MKERPILFSAPMVRALIAGTKTQTRRVVKPQPQPNGGAGLHPIEPYQNPYGQWAWVLAATGMGSGGDLFSCPYGQPGDRLWVRENGWERPERTPKMMREGADTWAPYYFDADYEFDATRENEFAEFKEWGFKRRPSIHMPRWASRILLEITAVRVERLQDISEADAKAEGGEPHAWAVDDPDNLIDWPLKDAQCPYRNGYALLWESINGAGSWAANPWVWVIEFRRTSP